MNYNDINMKAAQLYNEEYEENQSINQVSSQNNSNKNKKLVFIAIATVIFILFIIYKIFVPDYIQPIKKSIGLINKREYNINEYYKYKDPFENYYTSTQNTDVQLVENYFKKDFENLEKTYGENFKVSYKTILVEKLSDKELDNCTNVTEYEITKGYDVHIGIIISGDKGKDVFLNTVTILKINNKWCLEYMLVPTAIYSY